MQVHHYPHPYFSTEQKGTNVFPSGHVLGRLLCGAGRSGDPGSGLERLRRVSPLAPEEPGRRQRLGTWGRGGAGWGGLLRCWNLLPVLLFWLSLGRGEDEISWSRGASLSLTAAFGSSGD